jgi:hypothetical protein
VFRRMDSPNYGEWKGEGYDTGSVTNLARVIASLDPCPQDRVDSFLKLCPDEGLTTKLLLVCDSIVLVECH